MTQTDSIKRMERKGKIIILEFNDEDDANSFIEKIKKENGATKIKEIKKNNGKMILLCVGMFFVMVSISFVMAQTSFEGETGDNLVVFKNLFGRTEGNDVIAEIEVRGDQNFSGYSLNEIGDLIPKDSGTSNLGNDTNKFGDLYATTVHAGLVTGLSPVMIENAKIMGALNGSNETTFYGTVSILTDQDDVFLDQALLIKNTKAGQFSASLLRLENDVIGDTVTLALGTSKTNVSGAGGRRGGLSFRGMEGFFFNSINNRTSWTWRFVNQTVLPFKTEDIMKLSGDGNLTVKGLVDSSGYSVESVRGLDDNSTLKACRQNQGMACVDWCSLDIRGGIIVGCN